MKIGIDGIVLEKKSAGSLRIFEQLVTGLAKFSVQDKFIIFGNHTILDSTTALHDSLVWHNVRFPAFVPPALAQQLLFIKEDVFNLDLLHSPVFVPPLFYRGKSVMTVFDLTFKFFPQTMKWTGRLWWQLLGPKGFRKADRIITLSENTKRDLCRHFGIEAQKVKVIYPYTQSIFTPTADSSAVIRKYSLPDKYILYVGTLEPRKNVANLVRAYSIAKRIGPLEHKLVLCGKIGWLAEDIFKTIEELNLAKDIILLGYVPDCDLPGLYKAASIFVYLSIYEGFGLPVLEAMASGTPVLTSNTSSLPEVVGDAGIMVTPNNIEQIAIEMHRILSESELRHTMIDKGLRRAALFTFEENIRQTLQVYNEVNMHRQTS